MNGSCLKRRRAAFRTGCTQSFSVFGDDPAWAAMSFRSLPRDLSHFVWIELGYPHQFMEGQRHSERRRGAGRLGDLVEGRDEVGLRGFRLEPLKLIEVRARSYPQHAMYRKRAHDAAVAPGGFQCLSPIRVERVGFRDEDLQKSPIWLALARLHRVVMLHYRSQLRVVR